MAAVVDRCRRVYAKVTMTSRFGRVGPLPLVALFAAVAPAQGIFSGATVSPALQYSVVEDIGGPPYPDPPPLSVAGSTPAGNGLWSTLTIPGFTASGALGVEIVHATGSSAASFAYAMQTTTAGDELVVSFDYLARLHHGHPFPWLAGANVQGGCVLQVIALQPTTCGVMVAAHLATTQPPDLAQLSVDLRDNGSNEINGLVNGASPLNSASFAAYDRFDLGAVPVPIRIAGTASAASDGGNRLVTVHVEIRISPRYAAAISPYGTGCSAATFTPTLATAAGSLPQIGGTLQLLVGGLPAGQPRLCAGFVGFDNTSFGGSPLPIDLAGVGMPGCLLLIAPAAGLVYPLLSPGAAAAWPLPMPGGPMAIGQPLFLQAIAEAMGSNPAGLVTTPALAATVGL